MQLFWQTINRYKRELRKAELLKEVRQGQGKPNRLYILKPEHVENTLNSHYDYTRVAEMTTLDYSKRLRNDTEYSDTEINDTKYIHLPQEDEYVSFYLEAFNYHLGKEHMRVKESDYSYILDEISSIRGEGIEYTEWQEAVEEHFETLPKRNNGNILAFLKAKKRYFDV